MCCERSRSKSCNHLSSALCVLWYDCMRLSHSATIRDPKFVTGEILWKSSTNPTDSTTNAHHMNELG